MVRPDPGRGASPEWSVTGQNVGVTLGARPSFEDVLVDLEDVLKLGAGRLRGQELPALRAIAGAVGHSPPGDNEPGPLVKLLRDAVDERLSESPDGPTARYALGLERGGGTTNKGDRLRRAAAYKDISYERFRKEPVKDLMQVVAEELLGLWDDAQAAPAVPGPSPVAASRDLDPAPWPWHPRIETVPLPRAHASSLPWSAAPHEPGTPMADVVESWGRATESNLLYVCGPMGSGKTSELSVWAMSLEPSRRPARVSMLETDPRGHLEEVAGQATIVIEDFDSLSTRSELGSIRPDLSWLRSAFNAGSRCVVLTRRDPEQETDELTDQVRSPNRLADLGVKNPHVVRINAVTATELRDFANEVGDERLLKLAEAIERADQMSPLLMTPMILDQLYQTHGGGGIFPHNLYEAYGGYLKYVCGREYDREVSRIPGRVRYQAYVDLAWDIFRGLERRHDGGGPLDVSLVRVAERVQENVQSDRNLRMSKDFLRYEWTADFVDNGHIFGLRREDQGMCSFLNSGYYEYFVAEAARGLLSAGRPLGLDEARFAETTMDSPILTFLRAGLTPADLGVVAELAARGRLSWLDRLVCLYFLEEHDQFLPLLQGSPAAYWESLRTSSSQFQSLFLRKATLYQEVVVGRQPAQAYIDLLHEQERAVDLALERQLLRSGIGITESLLARLENPGLTAARPITIYRLGQMGNNASAIPVLQWAMESDNDLRSLAEAAISQIEERTNAGQ